LFSHICDIIQLMTFDKVDTIISWSRRSVWGDYHFLGW